MKRVLALFICCGLVFLLAQHGLAQTLLPQFAKNAGVTIGASVGSARLSISGYQSPFSSIIIKTKSDVFVTSTTADTKGYFSVSNTLINASILEYCFQAVDFKRVGLSESCVTIPGPITGSATYSDVFLPPTIGLESKTINAGEDGVIFGYTMPGATVTLKINETVITAEADASGYYSYIYENVPEGTFTITASATLNGKSSLEPTNQVILKARSIPEQLLDTGEKVKESIKKNTPVPFEIWPFILLALGFLVAIGILLYKLKFKPIMMLIDFFRRKKKMHHDWFLDKW
jgi:hypothetical protein